MFDDLAAVMLAPGCGEPTPQARFREELAREPKVARKRRARRGRIHDVEAMLAGNLQRVGHFIRLA